MNIAIVEPVGGHGGMNYYDFGLAKGLVAAQNKVIVYTCEETSVPSGLPFQVNVSFKGIWGEAPKFLRALKFVRCLFATLRDAKVNDVDVVHYHFFGYTMLELFSVKLARYYGFNVVVTAHDVECFAGEYDAKKALKVLSYADKVIAHNEVSKRELVSKITLLPSNIYIVPHGNYLDSIDILPKKSHARRFLGLSNSDKVILFFGQIKRVKGLDILLRSLSDVIKRYPDLKLVIAGKVWKDNFSMYEEIIRENRLDENIVSHIHYISDSEVSKYYLAADLVVLPYRKIYQSGVLLMAMSYSAPVLTSNIRGMTEIIDDGINGYTFESESIPSLSSKLIQVLSDPVKLTNIGKSGYTTVSTKHSWNRIGKITSKVYEESVVPSRFPSTNSL